MEETHTLIGNSSILNMKASRETTAIFCQAKNELGTENSTVTELDVQFPPQIVSSSNCTIDSDQMRCVCETEGNPIPLIQWSFPGLSPNISIISEHLRDKALRSVLTVIKPQWRDPVTLICHSSNSMGFHRQRFNVPPFKHENIIQEQEDVLILVFIAIRVVSLLVFPCAFLSIMRSLHTPHDHPQPTDMVMMEQLPVSNQVQTLGLDEDYIN
ncbi:hypothetical protein NL108_015647 [Boleophthalmus pectinirostris]|uniref:uncharacterized protein LOC129411845 n=1 Tax=Boleophthalmus pectinirostris TaxID=150288 RepID=UPI00243335C4|nr:uncharacterized protein LOC129411845 [Boleophthalmus pectinirostris]XP_055019954.1 uncharacterized protein LOC129411845 [Boleophthalmus pectinirostris]XP_055019955.1 uncharacterized protein LOC129411845 [Boleophthalmus pectinirostris]KAJ0066605.1 hypothetical protein NL108_015647 [Boleophthalmus pectinirostris]